MKLDIRLPIGLMFAIVGTVLAIFGFVSDSSIYAKSLGININLWWGLLMLFFGIVMLAASRKAALRQKTK
jgi:hypothetical protein